MKVNLRSNLYTPLDDIAAMPSTRILRALAHRSWVGADELYEGLDQPAYDTLNAAMSRLVRDGLVERRGNRYAAHEVRIADKGRAELDRRMSAPDDAEWSPARPGTEHLLCGVGQ